MTDKRSTYSKDNGYCANGHPVNGWGQCQSFVEQKSRACGWMDDEETQLLVFGKVTIVRDNNTDDAPPVNTGSILMHVDVDENPTEVYDDIEPMEGVSPVPILDNSTEDVTE